MKPLLLPEGAAGVDRTGWLRLLGREWLFVFDPGEGDAPMRLLPNAALEVMVATARGADWPIRFVIISGETTVFHGENYLLVRLAKRAAAHPLPNKRTRTDPSGEPSQNANISSRDAADDSISVDAPVEDVLAVLQRQQPQKMIMPSAPRSRTAAVDRTTSAMRTPAHDGSLMVRRPGRLIQDGDGWSMAFESDHPGYPEPPIKLLPSLSLERMAAAFRLESAGLVFLVSGETTLFEGENYLLPRMAVRRMEAGNLRK